MVSILPSTAVLLGQNIGQDVQWLQLKEGLQYSKQRSDHGLMYTYMVQLFSFGFVSLQLPMKLTYSGQIFASELSF